METYDRDETQDPKKRSSSEPSPPTTPDQCIYNWFRDGNQFALQTACEFAPLKCPPQTIGDGTAENPSTITIKFGAVKRLMGNHQTLKYVNNGAEETNHDLLNPPMSQQYPTGPNWHYRIEKVGDNVRIVVNCQYATT